MGICILNFSSISKINETTSIESSPRSSSDSDKSSVPPVWLVLDVIISTISSAALGIVLVIQNEGRRNGPPRTVSSLLRASTHYLTWVNTKNSNMIVAAARSASLAISSREIILSSRKPVLVGGRQCHNPALIWVNDCSARSRYYSRNERWRDECCLYRHIRGHKVTCVSRGRYASSHVEVCGPRSRHHRVFTLGG